jgi:hypothetical protein
MKYSGISVAALFMIGLWPWATSSPAIQLWVCIAETEEKPSKSTEFFKNYVGLTDDQIKSIRGGKAVAKVLDAPTADEVFVLGWSVRPLHAISVSEDGARH